MSTRAEPLSRDAILDQALEIVDAEGVGALSMRRLGSELGVEAMALYHHFPNKDAILDGVVDRVLLSMGRPDPGSTWRESIRAGATLFYRALSSHPNVAPLVVSRPFNTPGSIRWMETPLRILREAGFDDDDLVDAYHAISAYLFGWLVMSTAEQMPIEAGARLELDEPAESSFPLMAELGERVYDWSEGFGRGLDVLLEGFEPDRG